MNDGKRTSSFVRKVQKVAVITGLERACVVVLCALEDLCERREVHTEWHGSVASWKTALSQLRKADQLYDLTHLYFLNPVDSSFTATSAT